MPSTNLVAPPFLMLGASECPTEQRNGGATKFVEGMTCEEFEAMSWTLEKEEPVDEDQGCCYTVGFGAMMVECCQEAHADQPENGMLGESACPTNDGRRGGEVRFQAGLTCEEFELKSWTMEEEPEEEQGCCYNVGFGAGFQE